MGEAANISLKAIGMQDTHLLSKDPEDSLFNYKPKRHSEFRKYHHTRTIVKPGNVEASWPFGKTLKVEFKPQNMGDLLSNMWLSIQMPGISGPISDGFSIKKYDPDDFSTIGQIFSNYTRLTQLTPDIFSAPLAYDDPPVYPYNDQVYGYSSAISGDGQRIVVGSPNEKKIYVYRLENTTWLLEDTITHGNTYIGTSVSVDYNGTRIASVVPKEGSTTGTNVNGIIIFDRDTLTNQWSRNSLYDDSISNIESNSGGNGYVFTVSLSSDGTRLALGLKGRLQGGFDYSTQLNNYETFRPGVIVYTLGQTLVKHVLDVDLGNHNSVSLSDDGETLIISSIYDRIFAFRGFQGTVYYHTNGGVKIYNYSNGNWNSTYSFSSSDTDGFCSHGVTVNGDGTKAAYGFYTRDGNNLVHKIRVLEYNSGWTEQNVITPTSESFAGYSLDMSSDGNYLIIGDISPNGVPPENFNQTPNPYPSSGSGMAHIYKYDEGSWDLIKKVTNTNDTIYHGFSVSVNSDASVFVIGEPISQSENGKVEIIDKNVLHTSNYADQLGRHILKSATMYVDEIEVEKIYDDWGVIYDELYLEMSEKVANQYVVNRSLGYDSSVENSDLAQYSSQLMIPMHFFFSRKYSGDEYASNKPNRPYFPLCAIHKQTITFELEFHNQTFFTGTTSTIGLDNFKLITEEISITPEERVFLSSRKHLLITDLVRKHPTTVSEPNVPDIKNNLVPNIPVKCIHWFLRNTDFENENDANGDAVVDEDLYFHNRFNFSKSSNFDEIETFFNPVMDSASFYLNGNRFPNVTNTNHNYYKYLIPFRSRLSRPYRNIYTYSFSMNPINVEPSGNLDFSQLNSDKTTLELKLADTSKTYSLNMYYTGYQTFEFKNGFMTLAY